MKYVGISKEKVLAALKAAGLSTRELVKDYYGKGNETKGYFDELIRKNMGSEKLCKICNILGCRMDDLFEIEGDGATTSTSIQGSNNNVNSTVINQDVSSLQAENYALKKLIEEKDDRIKQLQENLKMVIEFANKKILTEKKDEEEKPK
jgi:hypothetical protein